MVCLSLSNILYTCILPKETFEMLHFSKSYVWPAYGLSRDCPLRMTEALSESRFKFCSCRIRKSTAARAYNFSCYSMRMLHTRVLYLERRKLWDSPPLPFATKVTSMILLALELKLYITEDLCNLKFETIIQC
jgi:hypothetical protein